MKLYRWFFACTYLFELTLCLSCTKTDTPGNRTDSIIKKMTLEEKVMQLNFIHFSVNEFWDTEGKFLEEKADSILGNGMGLMGIYSWELEPADYAEKVRQIQHYLVHKSKPGIPALFYGEGLHGFKKKGATHYPQAIALASSWDVDMVEKIYDATAKEMRVCGVNQALTPVLGLAREPRWGRFEELFSEDPFLVSRMGLAAVRGFQGRDPQKIDSFHVAATVKHFAVHSQPEGGRNKGPASFGVREIWENFLYPFEVAVKEGKALSVMASYNEIDGIPVHANHKFLTGILKKEWRFGGYVVGDLGGVRDLVILHHVAKDYKDAGRLSVNAGVDLELGSLECFIHLPQLVREGAVDIERIDDAVRRVLTVKQKLGLLDEDFENTLNTDILNSDEHKQLAYKAACNSAILLKNDQNLLPLMEDQITSIAVIGPNAADIHLGAYSHEPSEGISVLEGIRDRIGDKVKVKFAEGCRITKEPPSWNYGENEVLACPELNRKLIAQAKKIASSSDVVLLVLGGNESTCREAWADTHLGDRDDLNLLGEQEELVKQVLQVNKRVIVLLINGRPLSINYIAENVPAIIEGWYLGQETGRAVADILFGDVNPSGKLAVTFPRNVGQLPVYYNHKPSRMREYAFSGSKPLFPFGHGLSYTDFEYSELNIEKDTFSISDTVRVSVKITNTVSFAGKEVVQLYISDEVSSVTQPVKELKDFRKISLKPEESKTIEFKIPTEKLSFLNADLKMIVEPGWFTLMIGKSSSEFLSSRFLLIPDPN